MSLLIAFVGAAVIALVLWKVLKASDGGEGRQRPPERPARPRVSGPDDDPDFLRGLDEKTRKRDDPPAV